MILNKFKNTFVNELNKEQFDNGFCYQALTIREFTTTNFIFQLFKITKKEVM